MSNAKVTTDHAKIRKWVESRHGVPVRVQNSATDVAALRIDFPERDEKDDEAESEELSWDEFFEKFDEKRLAFVYQDKTAAGLKSRFNKFVNR
jgi:hypothetical protein